MTLLIPGLRNSAAAAIAATFVVGAALIALPFVVAQTPLANAGVRALAFALLYVMLALGLNIVVGFAGLLDL
ncbi:MAG: ABC transporter ATP-binding protein, partial [Burkholderiaceae bacterium]|nr:ABC transporter ATP-binding protein [Burkholderiaceae bacterium]